MERGHQPRPAWPLGIVLESNSIPKRPAVVVVVVLVHPYMVYRLPISWHEGTTRQQESSVPTIHAENHGAEAVTPRPRGSVAPGIKRATNQSGENGRRRWVDSKALSVIQLREDPSVLAESLAAEVGHYCTSVLCIGRGAAPAENLVRRTGAIRNIVTVEETSSCVE